MAMLAACVRVTARKTAIWRHCAACDVLAPLAPDQTHCRECQPAATAGTGRN